MPATPQSMITRLHGLGQNVLAVVACGERPSSHHGRQEAWWEEQDRCGPKDTPLVTLFFQLDLISKCF